MIVRSRKGGRPQSVEEQQAPTEVHQEETETKPDEVQEEASELEVQLKRMKELRKPMPAEGLPLET